VTALRKDKSPYRASLKQADCRAIRVCVDQRGTASGSIAPAQALPLLWSMMVRRSASAFLQAA
jgi:hypothetical protein